MRRLLLLAVFPLVLALGCRTTEPGMMEEDAMTQDDSMTDDSSMTEDDTMMEDEASGGESM